MKSVILPTMRLEPDKHLHSREHLLADDLSRGLGEPQRFAAYLGIAKRHHESDLRALLGYVLEKPDLPPERRGKYFFAALKGLPKRREWLAELRRRRRRRKTKRAKRKNVKTKTYRTKSA